MKPKRGIQDSIRELASTLKSVYSIILILGIVASAFVQVYPYLLQPWIVELARIITPILVAVLVSYILIHRASQKTSSRMADILKEKISLLTAAFLSSDQAILLALSPRGTVQDLRIFVDAAGKLDTVLKSTTPNPLLGFSLVIGKRWNIAFDEIAAFLIGRLGKETAKRLVDTADILKCYGKECLYTWNELVK